MKLLSHLRGAGMDCVRFPKAHPKELQTGLLAMAGFRTSGRHQLFTAVAQSN